MSRDGRERRALEHFLRPLQDSCEPLAVGLFHLKPYEESLR